MAYNERDVNRHKITDLPYFPVPVSGTRDRIPSRDERLRFRQLSCRMGWRSGDVQDHLGLDRGQHWIAKPTNRHKTSKGCIVIVVGHQYHMKIGVAWRVVHDIELHRCGQLRACYIHILIRARSR